MGIRDSLRDLLAMQEMTKAGYDATAKYAAQQDAATQKEDLRALAGDIPGLLQSGNTSEIAGRAYGMGDPTVLSNVLKANAKAATGTGEDALPFEELKKSFPDLTDDKLNTAAGLKSFKDQMKILGLSAQVEGNVETRALRQFEAGERVEDKEQRTRTEFVDKTTRELEPFKKEVKSLEELATMDLNDQSQFWMAATKALKAIGGDAGNLGEKEVARPFPSTVGKTFNDVLKYVELRDATKTSVDPATIKSLQGLFQGLLEYRQGVLFKKSQEVIGKQATARSTRMLDHKTDFIDDSIQRMANDLGGVAAFDKNGKLQIAKEISKGKTGVDMDAAGAADAVAAAKRLSPKNQAFALQKIQAYGAAGKPVPPEFMRRLKELEGK